ncbi:very short patch repair endonuclease [Ruegeria arenilitoris]|uniref:very short patch repair endonuclease n=1 Tax=Ruegeria arenilitoris TaxID=1173585 RepID=UPI00266FE13A|nr:DNA mismatch endonuclease Vsr [Ruegeria arenilitoris]
MTRFIKPISRSENMSRIRSSDTNPEVWIRRELHRRGCRYSLHRRDLPGRPDLVMPKYRAIIQIHGCFWHGHSCIDRFPKTHTEYWINKIETNIARDNRNAAALVAMQWRLLVVWECSLGRTGCKTREVVDQIISWLEDGLPIGTIDQKGLHGDLRR